MTPAPPPALPAAAPPVDIGALWKSVVALAEPSPRDQAMVEAFEPVSFADGALVVRAARGRGAAGSAIVGMLEAIASRAAGRAVRVRVDAPAPVRREDVAPPAAAAPGRAPSLRDDPVSTHPLVREVSALFDATIVRVELAGTLPEAAPSQPETDDGEQPAHGETDV